MKKKILAAREALAAGVHRVVLGDSRRPAPIRAALQGEGTVLGEPIEAAFPLAWPVDSDRHEPVSAADARGQSPLGNGSSAEGGSHASR